MDTVINYMELLHTEIVKLNNFNLWIGVIFNYYYLDWVIVL